MARTPALLLLLLFSSALAEPDDARLNHGRKVDKDFVSKATKENATSTSTEAVPSTTSAMSAASTTSATSATSTNHTEDGDHTCKVLISDSSTSSFLDPSFYSSPRM